MKGNITYSRAIITDYSDTSNDFQKLYIIFQATLKPGMRLREFKAYYLSRPVDYIDVTFIKDNETIIGFCAAAFYTWLNDGKQYTIGRAATGILEGYRGNTLPKWLLYKKYIIHWLRHPFCQTILSAYVANPIIYAMICKYTGMAYPRQKVTPPPNIIKMKDDLLRMQNLTKKENPAFVVEIHFHVDISEEENKRIITSTDSNLRYYLSINPNYQSQYGVMVLIPVNLKNIVYSCLRFLQHTAIKYAKRLATLKKTVIAQA